MRPELEPAFYVRVYKLLLSCSGFVYNSGPRKLRLMRKISGINTYIGGQRLARESMVIVSIILATLRANH